MHFQGRSDRRQIVLYKDLFRPFYIRYIHENSCLEMFLTIFVLEISEISEQFSLNSYFLNGDIIMVIFELAVFYLDVALASQQLKSYLVSLAGFKVFLQPLSQQLPDSHCHNNYHRQPLRQQLPQTAIATTITTDSHYHNNYHRQPLPQQLPQTAIPQQLPQTAITTAITTDTYVWYCQRDKKKHIRQLRNFYGVTPSNYSNCSKQFFHDHIPTLLPGS